MPKNALFAVFFLCVLKCYAIDFNNGGGGSGATRLTDAYGFSVENTPMDEMRTISPVRLVGSNFVGTVIDPNFWTPTVVNSSTATQANGQLTLASGTNAAGAITVQSFRSARYVGGSSNRYRGLIQLGDTGTNGNARRWGAFDGTNGAFFRISSSTLSACTMIGGVATCTNSSSWNGAQTVPTMTSCNTYEIYYTNKNVYYIINGTLAHTASFPANPWTATMNLPARVDNTNTSNTTSVTLKCRVQTIYRLGELLTAPIYKRISTATTTICKYGAGVLHHIVINNPTNNTITVYDNTAGSGTAIAIIAPGALGTPISLDYEVPFFTGLTIVTAGTPDLTIVYE